MKNETARRGHVDGGESRLTVPRPRALTIAGSDSGGEAGIQADLLTFARLKVRGVCAITCLTAQNRALVSRIEPVSPSMVRAQLEAVAMEGPIHAAKTGMLWSAALIREIVAFLKSAPSFPLLVDPVMIATSGRRLLEAKAMALLKRELLPRATLATPNVSEAETLLETRIRNLEQARAAARLFRERFGCAALIKGGHLPGGEPAADFLCAREGDWLLQAPRAHNRRLHGTGCCYSAAIAAWLARGKSLPQSVALAKNYITQLIHEGARESQ